MIEINRNYNESNLATMTVEEKKAHFAKKQDGLQLNDSF